MKIEKKEEKTDEPKVINEKIETAKTGYNYKRSIFAKDHKLFASRKTSLFKTSAGKYERQERQFKLQQQKAITAPKPPVSKENLKSPAPPEMKTLPAQ